MRQPWELALLFIDLQLLRSLVLHALSEAYFLSSAEGVDIQSSRQYTVRLSERQGTEPSQMTAGGLLDIM